MTTTESNKLIAEFMAMNYQPNKPRKFIEGKWRYNKVHFHTSWDWLMPVVEKIYNLDEYYKYVEETSGQFKNSVELGTRINPVYKTVVEFIEWYNENNN